MPGGWDRTVDVAVVGGGVSGLYAAWRLQSCPRGVSPVVDRLAAARGGPLAVHLFEAEPRLGGRLLTVLPPARGMAPVDLGALRYRVNHHRVRCLVEEVLRLPVAAHVVGAEQLVFPASAPDCRGRAPDGSSIPPPTVPEDSSAVTMMRKAIESVIGRDPRALADDDWLAVRKQAKWHGQPLTDWAWLDLLGDVMAPEAYRAVTGPVGYATTMGNWNAADALAWYGADIAGEREYRRPVGGMQSIARALAQRLTRAGGLITCNLQLDGIEVTSASTVRLSFEAQDTTSHNAPLRRSSIDARHVVLALPPLPLSRLIESGAADVLAAPAVRQMVEAVVPVPMLTICCCYDRPWWRDRDTNPDAGRPEVPLGQVLSVDDAGVGRGQTPGCTLTAYNNAASIGHWRALTEVDATPRSGVGDRWMDYQAPRSVAAEVHRLLRVAFGVPPEEEDPLPPYATVCKDWSDERCGGECHAWKVRQRSWEVSRAMMQPEMGVPVHICGEAYSLRQGWVEGALEHTDHLLDELFAIPTRWPDRSWPPKLGVGPQ